jgi:hypothetical protein
VVISGKGGLPHLCSTSLICSPPLGTLSPPAVVRNHLPVRDPVWIALFTDSTSYTDLALCGSRVLKETKTPLSEVG